MSQADLAARVNASVKTISFIENGHSENLGIIRLMCDVLQLPYEEIVQDSSNAVGERSAEYYDAARRRWALYYERIPPPLVERFCELVEAALKLLE